MSVSPFFMKKGDTIMKQKQTQTLDQKYNSSRMNLLLMVILTVVNIVLFFTGAETMMLFSATIPYYAVAFGYYFPPSGLATGLFVLAGILVLAYFLCWLLSKKNYVWMIVALVLFVVDTVALAALYIWTKDFSGILDALIHIWVLYYLIVGVSSGAKMRNLPEEVEEAPAEEPARVDPEHWAD